MTETIIHRPSPEALADEGRALARAFDHDRAELTLRLLDLLAAADGPVPRDRLDATIAQADIDPEAAAAFLANSTEHDATGAVVGFGLTGNPTPHRVDVEGLPRTPLWAWCAMDTLVFPVWLNREFTVVSSPPGETGQVRLRSRPDGPVEITPSTAVITWSMRSKEDLDLDSVEAIWRTACHRSYFFTDTQHAERWATGRDDIAIIPVADGFATAQAFAQTVLTGIGARP